MWVNASIKELAATAACRWLYLCRCALAGGPSTAACRWLYLCWCALAGGPSTVGCALQVRVRLGVGRGRGGARHARPQQHRLSRQHAESARVGEESAGVGVAGAARVHVRLHAPAGRGGPPLPGQRPERGRRRRRLAERRRRRRRRLSGRKIAQGASQSGRRFRAPVAARESGRRGGRWRGQRQRRQGGVVRRLRRPPTAGRTVRRRPRGPTVARRRGELTSSECILFAVGIVLWLVE